MRMREKMMEYSPEVKWVPGKTHYIADALSRSPLFETNEEEYTVSCSYISVETAWDSIKEGAKAPDYVALTKAIKEDKPLPKNSAYKTLYDRLSIRQIEDIELACLDSTRLVIPMNSQKAVLKELHRAHSGMQKTYATACQLYYWPGMKNCIKTFISTCSTCQKFAPAQPRTQVIGTAPSAAISPMSNLGMDLFDALGKKWLAVVCRFSGYAWLIQLNKTTTSAILAHLVTLFQEFGYPTVIRSDGGPQFRSEFIEFCRQKAIKHELASPYNPESNGLAEAAVKNLKSLVLKCGERGEDLRAAIAAWRNMLRADGSSPSQMFFGRTQKHSLPLASSLRAEAPAYVPTKLIEKRDKLHKERCTWRDRHSVVLPELAPGEEVLLQDYITGLWKEKAIVKTIREDGRSYWLEDKYGRTFVRGRRRLKKLKECEVNVSLKRLTVEQRTMSLSKRISSHPHLTPVLHKLPEIVTRAASIKPLELNHLEAEEPNYLCIFLISPQIEKVSSGIQDLCFYDVEGRGPKGLTRRLTHYVVSSSGSRPPSPPRSTSEWTDTDGSSVQSFLPSTPGDRRQREVGRPQLSWEVQPRNQLPRGSAHQELTRGIIGISHDRNSPGYYGVPSNLGGGHWDLNMPIQGICQQEPSAARASGSPQADIPSREVAGSLGYGSQCSSEQVGCVCITISSSSSSESDRPGDARRSDGTSSSIQSTSSQSQSGSGDSYLSRWEGSAATVGLPPECRASFASGQSSKSAGDSALGSTGSLQVSGGLVASRREVRRFGATASSSSEVSAERRMRKCLRKRRKIVLPKVTLQKQAVDRLKKVTDSMEVLQQELIDIKKILKAMK